MMLKHVQRTEGQTLVIVALALLGLIALVALAVDGGNLMAERRHMQNAADAGALAGARAICAQDADPEEQAALYATQNGAELDLTEITIDGQTAEVVAGTAVQTYFAGLIGFHDVEVRAEAAAVCGVANRACLFWPVAFSALKWDALKTQCGVEFVVIDSDKICGVDYDCDTDDDGVDDMIMGGGRGWLDLPWPDETLYTTPCNRNCGTDAVRCWLENPYPGQIPLPACIKSQPGVSDAAFKAAGDQAGKIVRVPLFDGECDADTALGDCGGNEAYHIVDIGCIQVVEYDKNYLVWDIKKAKWDKMKALIVSVSCDEGCYAACSGTGGGTPEPGDVIAVSLLK
ncbi:MAG: hypothetical protein JW892_10655 [Anaerolineae bacterium]|nr:hypothetical protein [Anaerolineae bacterium]